MPPVVPPVAHDPGHLFVGIAIMVAVAALSAATRNRMIRRRLVASLVVLTAYLVVHLMLFYVPSIGASESWQAWVTFERLLFDLALINAAVALLLNPWFSDRVPEHAPAIVQDALVVALVIVALLYAVTGKDITNFLTGSAIAAAVVGFALQDTLANAFAGLAIQVEKPFRIGHWITVGSYEGRVVSVTWRATKIRTKAGNLVVLPNNMVAREPINNYSQPAVPTRIEVEVGASYLVPPNDTRDAILTAMQRVGDVLADPAPDAIFHDFGSSALIFHARFWIDDYERDIPIKDAVRRAIYYEFHRRNIEIPWPIQVEYKRFDTPRDSQIIREGFAQALSEVSVFASLPEAAHRALADAAKNRLFADGEVIVREGKAGASMFVVERGRVAIMVGPEEREVAVTEAGGYFGEMSLLTGEPRTATVRARGDCRVLELDSEAFGAYVRSHPEIVDLLAASAASRRRELDESRHAASESPAGAQLSLAQRMRKFFGLA
jgi:small-conductance mechanosensitive channel/CRP-like cAMP-binding protein